MVKIEFMLFLVEDGPSYQMLLTGSKNIVHSQSYRIVMLEFLKIHVITVRARILIAIFQN